MKKIVIGVIISCVFIYLSVRDVNLKESFLALADARYIFLIPSLLLLLLVSGLRSLRWGLLLSPIQTIEQKKLYPIVCVGYMAIVILPMRIGELIRPYLVTDEYDIPLSSALATVFVERLLDILILLFILFFIIINSDIPSWLINAGYSSLIVFMLIVLLLGFLYFKTEFSIKILNYFLKWMPKKFQRLINNLLRKFIDGFQIITKPQKVIYAIFLSTLIWFLSGCSIYALFSFQNLELPLISAFVVMIITMLGISLPTAPGMLGNFQMGCIVALSFYNIQKTDAFLFSMVNYFIGIGLNIVLGLIFLSSIKISLNKMQRSIFKLK